MQYSMRRDGITQSIISGFLHCPTAGLYALEWEENTVEDRVRFGNVGHDVLEQMHGGRGTEPEHIAVYLEEARVELGLGAHQDQEAVEIDLAKVEAVMNEYVIARPEEFTGKVWLDAEMIFDIEWMGFRLRGKIDALYLDKKGAQWLMENKFRGRIIDRKLLRILAIDFQIQFYLLVWEAWKGERLRGVAYNIIRNPGTKPHVGEGLLEYKERLRKEISKNRAYYFHRYPIKFTVKDRADFEQELLLKLAYIERILEGKQLPFRNQNACDHFCDYIDLCVAGQTGKYRPREMFSELRS